MCMIFLKLNYNFKHIIPITVCRHSTNSRIFTNSYEIQRHRNHIKLNSNLSARKIMSISKPVIPIWLDCDPGHDDAFAILLAAYSPEVKLLGISIAHGNDTVEHCALNAKRFMWACGIKGIPVYQGINRPLVRMAKHCPEIHGIPGEQGVAGLCGFHFPDDLIFSNPDFKLEEGHAIMKMYERIMKHPSKVTLVVTGAQTNVAMALRMFPDIQDNVEKIVFMGGAMGVGNTGVAAEFNIEIDPEAAHIVFHSGIPLVMAPLEVTHSVLVTPQVLEKISKIDQFKPQSELLKNVNTRNDQDLKTTTEPHPHVEYQEIFTRTAEIQAKHFVGPPNTELKLPEFTSNYARCCSQLLTFFQSTYKTCFSFQSPPLHDPCAVFYITNPECFRTIEMFVDVEMASEKSAGRTLCDIHGICKKKPNILVCVKVDVEQFWEKMLTCMKIANDNSPLNEMKK